MGGNCALQESRCEFCGSPAFTFDVSKTKAIDVAAIDLTDDPPVSRF
jgi:hypothetical protein